MSLQRFCTRPIVTIAPEQSITEAFFRKPAAVEAGEYHWWATFT
jgi:hypothetical protein